jgi:hypothetical protein
MISCSAKKKKDRGSFFKLLVKPPSQLNFDKGGVPRISQRSESDQIRNLAETPAINPYFREKRCRPKEISVDMERVGDRSSTALGVP